MLSWLIWSSFKLMISGIVNWFLNEIASDSYYNTRKKLFVIHTDPEKVERWDLSCCFMLLWSLLDLSAVFMDWQKSLILYSQWHDFRHDFRLAWPMNFQHLAQIWKSDTSSHPFVLKHGRKKQLFFNLFVLTQHIQSFSCLFRHLCSPTIDRKSVV